MEKTIREKVGKNIKKRREELGLSQEWLAQEVGKETATYIAFIEKGDRNISTVDLLSIAKKLSISVADLIGEEKRKPLTFSEALRASNEISPEDRKELENIFRYIKNKK